MGKGVLWLNLGCTWVDHVHHVYPGGWTTLPFLTEGGWSSSEAHLPRASRTFLPLDLNRWWDSVMMVCACGCSITGVLCGGGSWLRAWICSIGSSRTLLPLCGFIAAEVGEKSVAVGVTCNIFNVCRSTLDRTCLEDNLCFAYCLIHSLYVFIVHMCIYSGVAIQT